MGKLGSWAFKQNPFIKIENGQTVVGKFLDWTFTESPFNPEQTLVKYKLEIEGETKFWTSGSTRVAQAFDGIEKGSIVEIKRQGEGPQTRYQVRVLDDNNV